jgi:hypothetical protein
VDPATLFAMIFGSEKFVPLVGESLSVCVGGCGSGFATWKCCFVGVFVSSGAEFSVFGSLYDMRVCAGGESEMLFLRAPVCACAVGCGHSYVGCVRSYAAIL